MCRSSCDYLCVHLFICIYNSFYLCVCSLINILFFKELGYVVCVYEILNSNLQNETKLINWLSFFPFQGVVPRGEFNVNSILLFIVNTDSF